MKNHNCRILAWGGIGDVLLLTPALKSIKAACSHTKVTVYCLRREHMEVLKNNPNIDALKWGSAFRRALYHLRLLRVSPINYADLRPSLYYQKRASEIIAEMLGVTLSDNKPEVYLTAEEEEEARTRLAGLERPVAIHGKAGFTENKDWSTEMWEQLAAENKQYNFFQLGSATEPLIKGTVDMRGLTLRESFALIKYADGFVGIDSCLAHAASAVDTPAVVMFGPTTPVLWGHSSNVNIYKGLRCSPCGDMLGNVPCPYGRPCMKGITVKEVGEALDRQLSQRSGPPRRQMPASINGSIAESRLQRLTL